MSRGTSLFFILPLLLGSLAACGQGDPAPVDETGVAESQGSSVDDNSQQPTTEFLTGDAAAQDGGSALIELGTFDPEVHGRLWVKVVREKTGEPMVNAPVELLWSRGSESAGKVGSDTDEEGLARFPLVARSFIQGINVGGTGLTAPGIRQLDIFLPVGEREPEVVLVKEAARFSGRVIDADGNPMADVTVQGWSEPRTAIEGIKEVDPIAIARTDADGRFRMGGMPGGPFVLSAELAGYIATQRAMGVNEFDEEIEGITLIMTSAHPVNGQVVDAQGMGVSEAIVEAGEARRWTREKAIPSGDDRFAYIPARQWKMETESDGGFVLPAVPDGTAWVVRAQHDHFLNRRIRLEADTPLVELQLDAGLQIHASIVGADSQPIMAGDMVVLGKSTRSTPIRNGSAFLSGLQDDPDAIVMIRAPGKAMKVIWPVDHNTDQSPLQVILEPAQPIRGLVLTADGDPLPTARLVARGLNLMEADLLAAFPGRQPEKVFQIDEQISDETGAFSFPTLYAGEWEIKVVTADGREKTQIVQAGEQDARIIF